MHRPLPRFLAMAALAGALVLPACTGDDEEPTTTASVTPTSITHISQATLDPSITDLSQCDTKAPGELMTEAEANIRFSNEGVCPGYVTVTLGTSVTWQNVGTTAYTVTVTADPTPDAPVYTEQVIQSGGSWSYQFVEPDQYTWSTDALGTFVGSVEVRDAASAP